MLDSTQPVSTLLEDIMEKLAPEFDDERRGIYPGSIDQLARQIQDYMIDGYSWEEAIEDINYSCLNRDYCCMS